MELRQLRHFLAVAKVKNIGKAADSLGITQQALSHSIAKLEEALGCTLFERGRFGASLTDMGETFQKRASLICAEVQLAEDEMEALSDGESGELRVGAGAWVANFILPEVVARFARAYPKVRVKIQVGQSEVLREQVSSGEIEFSLSAGWFQDTEDNLRQVRIGDVIKMDANHLIYSKDHPLAASSQPKLEDTTEFPWILPDQSWKLTEVLLEYLESKAVRPPVGILRTNSLMFSMGLMVQGLHVGFMGRDFARWDLFEDKFTGVPLPDLDLSLDMVQTSRRTSAFQVSAKHFITICKRVVKERETAEYS